MRNTRLFHASAAVAAVFALAACEQTTFEPTPSFGPAFAVTLPTATGSAGHLFVCKDSPDAAASFDFTYTVGATQGAGIQNQIGSPFSVNSGDCVEVLNVDNTATTTQLANFTVTETDPDNLFLGADLYKFNPVLDTDWTLQTADLANGVSSFVSNDRGVLIVFRNDEPPPPPPGDEGCTPGYWKNHLTSWAATGYSPDDVVEDGFSAAAAYAVGDQTLLEALNNNGGPGLDGASRILLRAGVAALLNAAHPDVDYVTNDPQDIIDRVNDALDSATRSTMISEAEAIDMDNNLGCPLN